MNDLAVYSSEKNKLAEAQKSAITAATAEEGMVTSRLTKDVLDELESVAKSADAAAAADIKSIGKYALATYAIAMHRDATYATRGRNFMRSMGINSTNAAIAGRYLVLAMAEKNS